MNEHKAEPTFHIGPVPIYGDLILAPMAGYSDAPYRLICREFGSAMSYTPCILDVSVIGASRRLESTAHFFPEERPVAMQLLGKDEDDLIAAAWRLMAYAPDIIDLNLGCPVKQVAGQGRGAALLTDPQRIGRLVARLTATLPVPITCKIRLGWDEDSQNYLEVAHILEDSGAAAIAVHGRTRAQGYSGRADWGAIARVREAVRVPALANGDVRTAADIAAIQAATGCAGVLIGRGAMGNPWIFARRDIATVPYAERVAMIRRHLGAMVAYYGERVGVLLFRKHVVKYVQELDSATDLRDRLVLCESAEALLAVLDAWAPPLD